MKRTFFKKILLFLALGLTTGIYAQTLTGLVTSDEGPLPGATVLVQGTNTFATTDFDGNFSIQAAQGAVLEISFVGYTTQQITVDSDQLDVLLVADNLLEEIIVTGYGTQTKRETTGAISTVKAKDLNVIPSGNIEQQFQGRIPGVTVISNGSPGSTSQIRVRGFGAFGGNEPLYVVDGVPTTNIDFLNPGDIESTTVLKDAAAASIYGARAANGVVVMTTKSGSRLQDGGITLDYTLGFTDPNVGGSPQMLNPQQMAEWTHRAYENNATANGTAVAYTHPQYGANATPVLPDYLHANGANGIVGSVDLAAIQAAYDASPETTFLIKANKQGTNWYDAITTTAPLHRLSFGANGANEKGHYYIGLGSQFQDGILINNILRRHTLRANSKYDITDFLSIGENIQATYRETKTIGGGGSITSADDESEILAAYRMPTIIPIYDEFGSYASTKASGFNNPH